MSLFLSAFPQSPPCLFSKPSPLPFNPLSSNPIHSSAIFFSTNAKIIDSIGFCPNAIPHHRRSVWIVEKKTKARRGQSLVCSASAAVFKPQTLQWVSAVSSAVLMLAKGTAIQKSFIVPLFALQAPFCVISWIKGDYGSWTAFLALLVRLFYFIPGELDLLFSAMLLVIVAPYQMMDLRGSQAGSVISLAIAGYLAFQHFSRAGSLRKTFDQGSVVATLAVICITAVSCLLLI